MSSPHTERPHRVPPTAADIAAVETLYGTGNYAAARYERCQSRDTAVSLPLITHTATVRLWPTGAVDIEVWPSNGYRVEHISTSAVSTQHAQAVAEGLLEDKGWRLVGPWAQDGPMRRVQVERQ